jgi:hypothetical protein
MELDINTDWVTFSIYMPDGHGGLQPSNLLLSMARPPDRYLVDGTATSSRSTPVTQCDKRSFGAVRGGR